MHQNYLLTNEITELHVEITNLCNAQCPMCARNNSGTGLSPNPGWGGWAAGESAKVFAPELTNLKTVFFCGTHGDPIASNNLIEAVRICKDRGLQVNIFTNGSLRNSKWWKELVGHFDSADTVTFGIDGIETNHLYRQNTDIDKILSHLKICCDAGIETQWDFLAFKHNEHELELCKQTAKEMGVTVFNIRRTARFFKDTWPVYNSEGTLTHYLEPPTDIGLRHPNYVVMQQISTKLPDTFNILCDYKQRKKIYVNSRLEVFPCCYISDNNETMQMNIDENQLHVPLEKLSLRNNTWNEILDIDFYKNDLVESFTGTNVIKRCIKTCGVVNREHNQNQTVSL